MLLTEQSFLIEAWKTRRNSYLTKTINLYVGSKKPRSTFPRLFPSALFRCSLLSVFYQVFLHSVPASLQILCFQFIRIMNGTTDHPRNGFRGKSFHVLRAGLQYERFECKVLLSKGGSPFSFSPHITPPPIFPRFHTRPFHRIDPHGRVCPGSGPTEDPRKHQTLSPGNLSPNQWRRVHRA
jgi:hypothetical protein